MSDSGISGWEASYIQYSLHFSTIFLSVGRGKLYFSRIVALLIKRLIEREIRGEWSRFVIKAKWKTPGTEDSVRFPVPSHVSKYLAFFIRQ